MVSEMVETKFDILNIEYLDVLTGEEVFDFPEQLYGISVDVPNDFKDKHFSFTEDLIRAEIESLFYRDGVDDLKVVDLTTFYAGTNDPLRGNYEDYEAETFEAESCVSCETPDWYWVGGLCSDSGELKCIGCCSCNDCHKRWSQLESGETDSNRQISSFSIDQKFHDAETYDVEFNEWADQELMSHGKDISFKDWAEDEGMKHGNTEITDWAQHEDESHDARYGAETLDDMKIKYDNRDRTFFIKSVDYDTDGEIENDKLPQEFTIKIPSDYHYFDENADEGDITDVLNEWISTETGFSTKGIVWIEEESNSWRKNAETKLSKTSCCCGADEANPCACMKAPEPMNCSAKAPKCACYKALEKNAEFLYFYVLNEKGESPADFNTLEEAQTYVANSSEPLEIYERRSRDDEAYKMDKKMNAEYDEEDMVYCKHCSDIVGNEKEVYGDETVEYEMANGELVCLPCHKIWMKEYKNDLDPHYSPFYAEQVQYEVMVGDIENAEIVSLYETLEKAKADANKRAKTTDLPIFVTENRYDDALSQELGTDIVFTLNAETKLSKTCPNCEKYGMDATTDYICDMCAQCKGCCETSYGCYDVAICNDCDGSFIGKDIDGCCGSCDDCCECDQDPSMNAEEKESIFKNTMFQAGSLLLALTLLIHLRK